MTEAMSTHDDVVVRAVSPWAVDHAPCITFGQVRALAGLPWLAVGQAQAMAESTS